MEIRLLGPFEVRTDAGDVLRITGRLRAILAVLALSAPEPVSVESIGARVWDDDPPEHLRNSVQTLITRLRQLTGPDLIATRAGGYALLLPPDAVDAGRFGLLLAAAAEDPEQERRLLGSALREWRGAPFADVESRTLHEVEAPRLVEQRLSAVERRIDLDLEAGRQAEVIVELRELTESHRLREPLWVRLITALERAGRQAEALAQYERVRTLLADELGSDPGPQLRELHSRLLTGAAPVATVPEQLPPGIGALVGRDAELAELDKLVRGQGPESSAPSIVLISGLAGAGKTSLALHWAHRVRDEFPAGQLFVNLRGYSADRPTDLGLVLEGFLRALGEDPKAVPATIDDRAARFRTLIGRRRILLVLDNAGSAAQVRTLLPGPGPLVVVTSRARLRGLAVHHHVHRIEVGVLGRDSARALLARGLATDVPGSEAGPLGAIADLCGRLPLALAIVADRLALGVESLDDVVVDLHDDGGRLDRLIDPEDAESDLRAVLSWSYQALDGDTARVFRLLGALPTGEFGAEVVAAIAGVTPAAARQFLDALVAAGLLQTPAARLYQFHDLVRLYAAELVDSTGERAATVDRLLSWYVATVARCRQAIRPGKALMPDRKRVLPGGMEAREFGTPAEALDWFDQERTNLVAVIAEARRAGADRDAVDLTIAVAANLAYRSLLTDGVSLLKEALVPAERTGDPIATAVIVQMLGGYSIVLGRYDEALRYLEQALETFRSQGHVEGEVVVETNTGYVLEQMGRPDDALPHLLRALELPATANRHAYALAPLSLTYVALGRFDEALAVAEQAVRTFGELGNRPYEGEAADTLASCHAALGDLTAARHWFGLALQIAREIGDRNLELRVMQNVGVVDQRAGDTAAAQASWSAALRLLEEGGLSDEEVVRRRELDELLKSI